MNRTEKLQAITELWKQCEAERMKVMQNARAEADKWKSEDDMYGWNFHRGIASGTIEASFIYSRVFSRIKELIGEDD